MSFTIRLYSSFIKAGSKESDIAKPENKCRRAGLDNKSAEALHKDNGLCEEHFESSCFRLTALCNKQLLKTAVPTIFDVQNPPLQKTPSRAPPKQKEPLNNIRRKDNVSPGDFVDENVSPASHNTNELHVAILKRKVNALRSRTWRLRQAHATQQKHNKGEISPRSDAVKTATDMDKLRSTLSHFQYLSPAAS
ncbi:hypothetical protein PoB_004548600 [Plakobranchus ocellatus]|uniref:THAP-type domain-containing protein n=1 Tax=Plakobranchus ocellatus TaxID=259542 RepID=A0AAV4BEZ0_9GAST|nr:hypothetical protein PoB_004548600 [Plakobranchus ocellatus]